MINCNTVSVQWQNIKRENSLAMECDSPEQVNMTRKGNLWTGWLIPYLIVGDKLFSGDRWRWWLECLVQGRVPAGPLPAISYAGSSSAGDAAKARKHLEEMVNYLAYRNGTWDAFRVLIEWILWGMGEGNYPDRLSDEAHDWLYKHFQVGHLQKAPYDYFGDIVSESKGNSKSWNPTAFFPTPLCICEMMAKMQFGDGSEKGNFITVYDPCVGTGRMLLASGSDSIFLFGQDIDPLMVAITKINLHLYVPWAALPLEPIDEEPYYYIPMETRRIASSRLLIATQCWYELMGGRKETIHPEPVINADFDPLNPPGDGASLDQVAGSLLSGAVEEQVLDKEQLALF